MAAAMNQLTFKAAAAKVSVPASSANLGPGFDSLCLALEIRDEYVAQILDGDGADIDVIGEGAEDIARDAKNLVYKSMMFGFKFMGKTPKGIAIRAKNSIPQGRGMGSSASAIVGGLSLARALVVGGDQYMTNDDLIALGTELEGHPDNVAAALLGGATIAWMENLLGKEFGKAITIPVAAEIKAVVFLPENHLATSKARKFLPDTVPYRDAVVNSSISALLVHALSHRPDLLFAATEDHLHQEYRGVAMPKSLELVKKLRAAGIAATISGAGPSVLVLHTNNDQELADIVSMAPDTFKPLVLEVSQSGAK